MMSCLLKIICTFVISRNLFIIKNKKDEKDSLLFYRLYVTLYRNV